MRVPLRVIVLKDTPKGFDGEVTRTNNLQNRIEARDFVAQDPEQTRIQMEMGIERIEYQFLRSEDFVPSPNTCDLIELTTALACASSDIGHATAVKTGIGRVFLDLKRTPYKALFNRSVNGANAFNVVLVQRIIDSWIDNAKDDLEKRAGYAWGTLVHGNRVLAAVIFKQLDSSSLMRPIADFRNELDREAIRQLCETSYQAMVNVLDKHFPGRFLAVLFKSPVSSKEVYDDTVNNLKKIL